MSQPICTKRKNIPMKSSISRTKEKLETNWTEIRATTRTEYANLFFTKETNDKHFWMGLCCYDYLTTVDKTISVAIFLKCCMHFLLEEQWMLPFEEYFTHGVSKFMIKTLGDTGWLIKFRFQNTVKYESMIRMNWLSCWSPSN